VSLVLMRPGERLTARGLSSQAVAVAGRTVAHTVAKGETLYALACAHNTTVAAMQRLNNLDGTTIHVGRCAPRLLCWNPDGLPHPVIPR
jgi:hypothetical protein